MDPDKDVFLNKDETNDKRSWVKILIIVLLLLLIIGGIVFGINIVIKNVRNKGYKETIDKIQDAANTYVVEQSNGMLWLVNKDDKVYQCITVQNLIDKKYFDDSILNSEIGDDRKVLNSDYIYIEKDQTTKKIMKKILLYNTESEYVKSCGVLSNVEGNIDINVPPEYSKSKEVVITYNLKADIGSTSNYKYSYRFDAQNDKEDISNKEFIFDDKNQIISKVIVNDNGWIYAKMEKSDGTVISNVSMEINGIDRKEPIIYADEKLNTSVRGNIVIPFTISDTGSGIKNEDIKLSDFKVYIGDNLLTSNYTFEKVKDSSNTFNYNLKIENFNYYGEVKIIIDKDKIKDNLGIGNAATTINTGVTFNNKYVISYKSNGGSGTLEDTICTYDVSCKLNKNTFNKIGYTFLGWAITSEGDVVYNDNHLFKTFNSKNDINLFAVWEANPYLIKYDANGGTGSMTDSSCIYDNNCTLKNNTFVKTGYTFAGWNTKKDGSGTNYTNAQEVKNLVSTSNGSIVLYAKWNVNTYLIKYDANGGTGSMIDSSCIYDNNCTLRNNTFVRTGYTFAGWNTKKDGSGTNYTNTQEVKNLVSTSNGSIVLYAKWNANQLTFNDQSYTVTYSESDSQVVFNGANFGTGNYIYTLSGEATSYFSLSGTTLKIKSSTPVNAYNLNVMVKDQNSGVTKTAKIVINIIKAATATIGECNSLVYNGSSQVLASGGKYITYSNNSGIDAGTYSNIIMQTDSNHTFSDGSTKKTLSCSIDKKQVSVSWGNTTTFTYNGSSQGPTASVSTGVSSETMTVVRTTQVNANADNYTSSASCSSVSGGRSKCDNYSLVNNTKEYKINQADGNIKLSASNESIIFGTSTKSFTVTGHHGGTLSVSDNNSTAGVSLSGSTVSISNLSSINAGTVITVTVTSGATQNYKAASATYKLTINPSATATVGNCLNPIYTGSALTLAGNGSNVKYTNNSGTNVSSYTVTASVVNSNYTFSDGSTSKTLTCSITKANGYVNLAATSGTIKYGTSQATFTVSKHHGGTLSVSDDNSTASVSVSGRTVTISNLSSINAGTVITVTVTSGANQNYEAANVTYKLTVNPATTATVGNCLNPTYTGSAVTLAGNGSNVKYTNNSGTNVSDYIVTATVVNSNYTFSDGSTSKKLTCSITQANGYVNLAATSGTIKYGTSQATFTVSKHHGGTLSVSDDNSTASVSVSGSTVTISNLSSVSASTVITVTVTSAATQNYKVASATYKLTVNPATTATVGNCLNPTYTGSAVTLAGNGSNVKYTNNSGIDVSSYTVTASVVNSNYTFSDGSTSKTLTCGINQANGFVNLASTSGSVKYGTSQATFLLSSNHGGTLSVSDNNSTATVSLSGNTVTISNLNTISAGTSIVVTVTGAAVQNYKAASSNYTLTIAKNDSNPTSVVAKGGVYSGTALQLVTTSNAQGTVYYSTSTSLTSSNYNTSGSTTIPTGTCNSAAGNTYTVYWYTPGNTNYTSASGNVKSTVTCKQYTISYDMCSGSGGPSSQTKYHGVNLTLSSTAPTRSGYTFKGWATSASGGCSATSASYSAGGTYSVSMEGNATLYAVWMNNNNKCTVGNTFDNCLLTENRDSDLWTVSLTDYTPSPSEYRFVGTKSSPPDNYICFGTSSSSTCTSNSSKYMYRIIGVFTEGGTKYLKLIKNTSIGDYPAIDDNFNSDNRWSATTLYSSINGSGFLNNTTYIPNSTWKNKIVSRTWVSADTNLNGYNSSGIKLWTLTPSKIYCLENNISSCKPSGAIYYSSTAKIGLMYTTDYNLSIGSSAAKTTSSVQNYASTLKTGWMYNYTNFSNSKSGMIEWSMTRAGFPVEGLNNARFYGIYVDGYPLDAENRYGAEYRPVFYIKASELYGGGLGTSSKPFIISE